MPDPENPPPQDDRTATLPGLTAPVAASEDIGPGTLVGNYRVIQRLGAGGMGDVWLAEQLQPIQRQVALKLVQQRLLGGLAEAYFEVERQALARMEHPAIAKVYDAGRTDQGFPYFAMERVEGVPLHDWRKQALPDLFLRLRLMISLARGVQHAHQRGVVHRDLKPSNILVTTVDGRPQPKIIDFGIAVGLGDTPHAAGPSSYSVAGTAAYMSPEQAEGRPEAIDTRSDVYALGMILLGLLLPAPGLRALGPDVPDARLLHDMIRQSLSGGRPRDSAHAVLRGIPSDLRYLLLHALATEREQRLASAEGMAFEIERFLQRKPLESVPSSPLYRIRRFAQRHRVGLAAAALVLISLLSGLTAALHGMWRAEQEAQRSRAMASFMGDVLTGVDPDRASDLDRQLLELILDDAAARARQRDDLHPEVLVEIEDVIGGTYDSLADYTRALEFRRQAHHRALAELGPNHATTLRVAGRLADVLANNGQYPEAEAITRDALARALARHRGNHRLLGNLRVTLAWILRESRGGGDALVLASEGVADLERIGAEPGRDGELLDARYVKSVLLSDAERFDEAESLLRDLIDRRARIDGEDHPKTLRLRNSLAVTLLQQRRYADAEPVLRQALDGFEATFGANHSGTLGLISNLGGALRQQGKVEESGPHYRRAMEGLAETLGEAHPRAVLARHNHANYLQDDGQYALALAEQTWVLERAEAIWGREHLVTSEALVGTGKAEMALGQLDRAQATLAAALAIKQRVLGSSHRTIDLLEEELQELERMRATGEPWRPRHAREGSDSRGRAAG